MGIFGQSSGIFGYPKSARSHRFSYARTLGNDPKKPAAMETRSVGGCHLSQTVSAARICFVIASGCEISARFAPIRLAMNRCRSGLIVRSCVDKLIGMDFAVEVVLTVLPTGPLDDEKPISLLIIGSPESGKTPPHEWRTSP
jgi:hypothetical protein